MSTQTPAPTSTPPAGRTENALRGSIRRHPLTWFFTLAYGLSWVAWLPYVLSGNGLGVWHFTFPGGAGASQITGVLPGAYLGPIGSALLIIALTEGRAGLRTWRGRMTRFKVGWRWYLAVLVSVPLALVLASAALSGDGPARPSATVLLAFLPGLAAQMITTGLAEEPGWREFAMPRMQRRNGPLNATLVVGVLWGCWHLPLFLTDWGGGPDVAWTEPVEFVVTATLFSFVMTWVFNRSGESMPLVMLLHCGINNYFSVAGDDLFPGMSRADVTHAFLLASLAGAVIALAATRGRLGLPKPQPAPVETAAG
ncbi:type II CAAX endopeptidase family protein [Streptomyces sp. KAU_LT]|uniref:CPBP family intramembrane glutamic endopeptidase n=1 Tax=unclassified Streptomyces TaxID=2593676 RepID=UPI0024B7263A|nr:type II CAAX endopeptidase family protein [Streptomyces sp. KAU_LT]MDI9835208.1 type II CAAX endopeptidase family protein [Streptomyces sp. KAU_LT]